MAMLSKNEILSCDDKRTKKLHVKQWDGDVIVAELTAFDRDTFEQTSLALKAGGKAENISSRLVSLCLVDEAGKRLFSDEDIKALGQRSGSAMNQVLETVLKLNNLTDDDIDELAKN